MQPIVEGVPVTNNHRNALMLWTNPHTAKTILVKMSHCSVVLFSEIYTQVRLEPGKWGHPKLTKCEELKWFRKPDYTGEDLVK